MALVWERAERGAARGSGGPGAAAPEARRRRGLGVCARGGRPGEGAGRSRRRPTADAERRGAARPAPGEGAAAGSRPGTRTGGGANIVGSPSQILKM